MNKELEKKFDEEFVLNELSPINDLSVAGNIKSFIDKYYIAKEDAEFVL